MLRTAIYVFAALTLVAASALAAEITDVNNTFRFTVPEGWTQEPPPMPALTVVVVSPRRPETGGNCNVVAGQDEATKSMSQSEVEAQAAAQINEEFWKGGISAVRGVKSTTIEKWGDKTQRGRKVFYMKATTDFAIGDVAFIVTQVIDLHPLPGRTYVVTCTARAEGFAREESDFESIMASFEPTPEMTVAAVRDRTPVTSVIGRSQAMARNAATLAADSVNAGAARAGVR